MSKKLSALRVHLARFTGSCVVVALGVEAARTREAACGTLFAMTLGVALAVAASTRSGPASS